MQLTGLKPAGAYPIVKQNIILRQKLFYPLQGMCTSCVHV